MEIIKTMRPGVPGTKRLQRKYKDKLITVRYRKKLGENKLYTTVELIVDERDYEPGVNYRLANAQKHNALVPIKIAFDEVELRERVKQAGGKWHMEDKVWLMPLSRVNEMRLSDRIVERDVDKYRYKGNA